MIAAGVEAECRIGAYMGMSHYEQGWHNTATIGTIGAAVASSHLLKLDAERCATAMGIAATTAAGLKCMFGTHCKPLHAGQAARNGLFAADHSLPELERMAALYVKTYTEPTDHRNAMPEAKHVLLYSFELAR